MCELGGGRGGGGGMGGQGDKYRGNIPRIPVLPRGIPAGNAGLHAVPAAQLAASQPVKQARWLVSVIYAASAQNAKSASRDESNSKYDAVQAFA